VAPSSHFSPPTSHLYEDEGDTQAYIDGAYTMTELSASSTADGRELTIGPAVGSFDGQPTERAYQVVFLGVNTVPATATINGQSISDWSYDEPSGNVTVNVPATSCTKPTVIAISQTAQGINDAMLNDKGQMTNDHVYDLQGRRIQSTKSKGIYIVNGKKTVLL